MMKICLCSTLGQASSGRVVTTCHLNRLQGPSLSIDLGLCVCLMALERHWIVFSCFIQTQFWTNLFNSQMTINATKKKKTQTNRGTRQEQRRVESTDSSFLYTKVHNIPSVGTAMSVVSVHSRHKYPDFGFSLSPLNPGMKGIDLEEFQKARNTGKW